MGTLVEIAHDLVAFEQLLLDGDGELTPDAEAALDQWFRELGVARDTKLDNYCALLEELKLRADARKEAELRLAIRRRVDENLIARLKERLKYFFETQSLKSIETERYKISLARNGGKVPLKLECQAENLPPIYQRHVIEPAAEEIRIALESGNEVPGCHLEPRGTHIRIS